MDEARSFRPYRATQEMPDEFHRQDFAHQQFGLNDEPPELDGYNDYGASNGSRAEAQSSDCPGAHSFRHGARTAGYRPDLLHGPQPWTPSEQGAGFKDNRSSQTHLSNGDLDRNPSGPRYAPPNVKNGKKHNQTNNSRIERVKRLPMSSKSPTGQHPR